MEGKKKKRSQVIGKPLSPGSKFEKYVPARGRGLGRQTIERMAWLPRSTKESDGQKKVLRPWRGKLVSETTPTYHRGTARKLGNNERGICFSNLGGGSGKNGKIVRNGGGLAVEKEGRLEGARSVTGRSL